MKIKKELVTLPIDELIPYERNNKIHDSNVSEICDSIDRNTYVTPIIINKDKVIICGHGRTEALKCLDYKEVEVLMVSGLTKTQEADLRISDNKIAELSERDFKNVELEIKEFDLKDLDVLFNPEEEDIDFEDEVLPEKYIIEITCDSPENQNVTFETLKEMGYTNIKKK